MTQNNNYDANSLKILEGLEAVRKRPGMYIGSTGIEGLHHLIWEIVDNSMDEAMGGFATTVSLIINKDGSITVEDDGRGIPIDINQQTGLSGVETVLTILHAGGKFDNQSYKVSGGLHGVGASCVNALSTSFEVWVCREYKEHYVKFTNGGHTVAPLCVLGDSNKKSGTKIKFYPDFSIMEKNEWDEDKIILRLKQLAFLNAGVNVNFYSEQTDTKLSWSYPDGLKAYVLDLNTNKVPIFNDIIFAKKEDSLKSKNNSELLYAVKCELAFQYTQSYSSSVYSFCNNINTIEGGSHEEGFKFGITKALNEYCLNKKLVKEQDDPFSKDDVCEGLTAIISIKHAEPQYEGQTKKKLGNTEVRPFVSNLAYESFLKYLYENPDNAKIIFKKIQSAQQARIRSQEARDATRRKSPFESNSLPGKLADCSIRDASVSELYIVEGDSAGGSAKSGREREFQAILPLKGKILNVEKAPSTKVYESDEVSYLISAIGAGVGPEFNIDKIRYNKIIIMTDADVDGAHIRTLLLTFFFRYMQQLILNGNVYIAQPPLYKFSYNKVVKYAYSDAELEEFKASCNSKYNIQRYKGLGEMDPNQLWETTMDPENRILVKVSIEDAAIADQIFTLLMSDDVPPRKEFIQEHAKYVKNIDA